MVVEVSTNDCTASYRNDVLHMCMKWDRRWSFYLSVLVCVLSILPLISANEFGIEAACFLDDGANEKCTVNLIRSDKDDNRELNSTEFVSFIDNLSDGRISAETFSEVPLRLRMVFHWSACSCMLESDRAADTCCIGAASHVNVYEVESDLTYNMNEAFCCQVVEGIRDVEDMFPSLSPSSSPGSATTSPTSSPTMAAASTPAPPTANPTSTPTDSPTMAPATTDSPSIMTAPPTASPTASPTSTPNAAPSTAPVTTASPTKRTASPTSSPTRIPTDAPSMAPVTTPSPTKNTSPPTASPTSSPTITPPETLCIGFQYELMNNRSLSAEDIKNEVNNSLKTGLMTATKTIVIKLLNETYPRISRRHGSFSWTWEDMSITAGGGLRRQLPEIEEAAELADAVALGLDSSSYAMIHEQVADMRTNARRLHRRPSPPDYHVRGARRLVYYSDDYPVEIQMIVDSNGCLMKKANATSALRCAIVFSTVCVVLETGDNPLKIRETLVRGLGAAIESGEFEATIPPNSYEGQ